MPKAIHAYFVITQEPMPGSLTSDDSYWCNMVCAETRGQAHAEFVEESEKYLESSVEFKTPVTIKKILDTVGGERGIVDDSSPLGRALWALYGAQDSLDGATETVKELMNAAQKLTEQLKVVQGGSNE